MPKSFRRKEKASPEKQVDVNDLCEDDVGVGSNASSAQTENSMVCCQLPVTCFKQLQEGSGQDFDGRRSQQSNTKFKDCDETSTNIDLDGNDGECSDDMSDGLAGSGKNDKRVCSVPWPSRALMAPPFYADLGKNARDVFGKGYHFGLLKLDLKTKTNTGVEFSTGGVQNIETKNVVGSLETKYKFKDYGVTFTEKWNTDNVLATEIALADFCEGAKLTCDTSFIPHKGDKSLRLKAEFKNDLCALNLESDFKTGGPLVKGAAVLGYGGWLCGYATAFDASRSKLVENKFTMGFTTKDFILHTSINDGRVFTGSIFHKVSNRLETGVQVSWASDSNSTDFGVGCKYSLDPDASVRVKVNNQSLIGLGYSQKLRDGVTVAISTQINGKNIKEGGHNVGFSLELEA